jgi:hypothetical protein
LVTGDVVRTRGYHDAGDGGSALYVVEDYTGIDDNGYDIIRVSPSHIARLVKTQSINVKQFGAKGDNTGDDSQDIQAAIDYCLQNLIQELHIPKGVYLMGNTVTISNYGNGISSQPTRPSHLSILGEGAASTVLKNNGSLSGSMLKVNGIYNLTASTYLNGGSIEDILFDGDHIGTDYHGLEILAWWYGEVKNCKFQRFSGDGIRVTSNTVIDSNPDFSASLSLKFTRVGIERCKGYGFNDEGSQNIGQGSPSSIFEHCIFILNRKGGAYVQSSAMRFINCSFASNGWFAEGDIHNPDDAYGIFYGGTSSTFNARHIVEGCEFDNNKTAHIGINSMSNSVFRANRFIHDDRNPISTNPTKIEPSPVSIIFDPNNTNKVIKNVEFRSNFFRTVNNGTFPNLTLFEWVSRDLVSHIYVQNNSFTDNTVYPNPNPEVNLTAYKSHDNENMHLKNNYVLRDNNFVIGKKVTSNGTPPAFYIGSINENTYPHGQPTGGSMYRLYFNRPIPNIFHGGQSNNSFVENKHYNTSTGVFTCPETGLYRIDVQLTLRNVPINQQVRLHVRKNGNLLFSDYVWGTGNSRINTDLSSSFFALKGDEIYLEIGESGAGRTLEIEQYENYGFNRLNIRLEE